MNEAIWKSDRPKGYKEVQIGPKSLEIPEEWDIETIPTLCNLDTETFDPSEHSEETFEYIDIESVSKGTIDQSKTIPVNDAPSRAKQIINSGDTLVGKVRPYLQAFAHVTEEHDGKVCSTGFAVLSAREGVSSSYITQGVLSKYFLDQMTNRMTGTSYPAVNKSDFKNVRLFAPPLPEQHRIADILSTVDKQIQQTDEIIASLNELEKGFERRAISGEGLYSIDELREDSIGPKSIKIPQHWEIKSINDLAEVKGGKRLPRGHGYADEQTDYPYIRVVDFVDGIVSDENIKHISEETRDEIEKYTISSNDVYISIAGHGLGISGTVPEKLNGANLTENAAKLTDLSGILNDYLAMYLRSSFGQAEVQRFTVGSGQPKLALKRINDESGCSTT